jgi:hypothetical protein
MGSWFRGETGGSVNGSPQVCLAAIPHPRFLRRHRRPLPYPLLPRASAMPSNPRRGGGPIHDPAEIARCLPRVSCGTLHAGGRGGDPDRHGGPDDRCVRLVRRVVSARRRTSGRGSQRHGWRPPQSEPMGPTHDLGEHCTGHRHLGQLENDVSGARVDGTSSGICRLKRSMIRNPEGDRRHGWNDR